MEESPRPEDDEKTKDAKSSREWSRYGELAIELLGYLAVLGYGGWYLDQHYGWGGQGVFWGLILGMAAWIYRVLKQTWHLFK